MRGRDGIWRVKFTQRVGSIDLKGLKRGKRYDIYVSDATADGLPSDSVRRDLDAVA